MGEGGAVNIVSRPPLKTYAESFRDWGRDCWCPSGKDNSCGKRFGWNLGELPPGYDHKYTYSHLGYNLKPLDPQSAIGRKQLLKLPAFIQAREQNWEYLRAGLDDLSDVFNFSLPTHATAWKKPSTLDLRASTFEWDDTHCRTHCSWFGFMLRVKPSASFTHTDLARHLDEKKIGNRMFFGGNLLRQPVFVQLRKDRLLERAFSQAEGRTGGDARGTFFDIFKGQLGTCFRLTTSGDGKDVLEPLDSQGKPLLGDDGRPMTTTEFLDQIRVHPVYGFLFQQRGPAGMQAAGGLTVSGIGSNGEPINPQAMTASELYRAFFAFNGRGARR
jgi:hypothetical protein